MKSLNSALKGKHTLIFVDFEGTQFSHEIIASGLVKCRIDDAGNIIDHDNGILIYTRPRSSIGKIVTDMTSLSEEFIKENGKSWGETIDIIQNYIGSDLSDALFICFGSNDMKMVIESCRMSHPDNSIIAKSWISSFFDIMTFFSQYIRDDRGNTFSLVNFLKIFSINPVGNSHNPLNDAMDLMNLYQAFINNPNIVFDEYQKQLKRIKIYPTPIKEVITRLIDGEDITSNEFKDIIRKYLE